MLKKRSFHAPIAFRRGLSGLAGAASADAAAHSEPSTSVAFTAPLTKRCSRSSRTYTPPAAAQPSAFLATLFGRHAFLRGRSLAAAGSSVGNWTFAARAHCCSPSSGWSVNLIQVNTASAPRTLWSTTSSSASANSIASSGPFAAGALIELPPSSWAAASASAAISAVRGMSVGEDFFIAIADSLSDANLADPLSEVRTHSLFGVAICDRPTLTPTIARRTAQNPPVICRIHHAAAHRRRPHRQRARRK